MVARRSRRPKREISATNAYGTRTHPQIPQVWADSAYASQLVTWAEDFLDITLKTVSRLKGAKGFVVLPRRWRVERTRGWIVNARRNVRDTTG